MKTFAQSRDVHEIERRISELRADDPRLWGRMTAADAVCHLHESYRIALGERSVQPVRQQLPGPLIKFLALRLPVQWPKSTPTLPELELGQGAPSPGIFDEDKAALLAAHRRFSGCKENRTPHAIFGRMTPSDWMRWGYLHADHHLRQFGR